MDYHTKVLIPFIDTERAENNLPSDTLAWFRLDREQTQIKCYQDEQLLDELEKHYIAVGKPPASTTEITQPCDNGNCFRSPKASLRYLYEEEVEYDPVLVSTLKGIVEEQRQKYSGISAAYEKSIVRGLIKVHHCLVKGVRRATIKKSFKNCGIYPLSIQQILSCSTSWSIITEDERQLCLRSMPELTSKMARYGTLTENVLDRALIPQTITERTNKPCVVDALVSSPINISLRKRRHNVN
jgi:hypothetical protein